MYLFPLPSEGLLMTHCPTHEAESCKISISFPKSNEDHRLQLFEIHGKIFAIVFAPLESEGPIHLECEKWTLFLLAPIKSASNIKISAENIVSLCEINSEIGSIDINSAGYVICYSSSMDNKQNIVADKGVFNFSDDPGGLLFLYRLFEEVVLSIRSNNAESITHAQNNIIKALCTLSNKIGDTTEDTTIRQALQKWAIPLL